MLNFPSSTVFGRRIPKQKFYEHLEVPAEVKHLFVEQVRLITWENKLSAATMNLAAGQNVQEIEVFRIKLTGQELDQRILNLMDQQIPYHILFVLERPDCTARLVMTYKEASQTGNKAFQLKQSYHTDWMPLANLNVPVQALDLDALYEAIVRSIAGNAIAAPETDSLKEAVEQTQQREKLEREIGKLKLQMHKEKRLAKQMEIRREIQRLEAMRSNE